MSKRTLFTTITPMPPGLSREAIIETLHDHIGIIDLQPHVIDRKPIRPPKHASPEEFHCSWYEITDKVSYLPGVSGKVTYSGCFHDLPNGLQTHIYAPLGLDMQSRWKVGGNLPGEPIENDEIGLGIPKEGLYLREDVDMRCNILATSFVKKTIIKAHDVLVNRLKEKVHIMEIRGTNERIKRGMSEGGSINSPTSLHSHGSGAPPYRSPAMSYHGWDGADNKRASQLVSPFAQMDPAYQQANPYAKGQQPYSPGGVARPQEMGAHEQEVHEAPADPKPPVELPG